MVYLPEGYTPHFRDPKVWKKNGRWWMVVGAQTKELKGNVALFVSDDLKKWQWKRQYAGFFHGLGVYV